MYTENSTKRYMNAVQIIREKIEKSDLKDYTNKALKIYDNIDEQVSIAEIEAQLPRFDSDLLKDYLDVSFDPDLTAEHIQALSFTWSYDGGNSNCLAFGSLIEDCVYNETGDTDDYHFEMNIETGKCIHNEWGQVKVNVMEPWYELSMKVDIEDDELTDEITALFTSKFCLCFQQACSNVYNDLNKSFLKRPFHIFIGKHDRWPMHVYSLE